MEKLLSEVTACEARIVYIPLEKEVSFSDCSLFTSQKKIEIIVPVNIKLDPIAFAGWCISEIGSANTYLLIPGRLFDIHGTRYGRGAGWYDRFLSKVPKEWLRIGILSEDQLSSVPLVRQVWDEPMDWLSVRTENGWFYVETGARAIESK